MSRALQGTLELELPSRYEPIARLGKGGGGEVWAVRERHSGANHALKVLSVGAKEREMAALVREAVALSGLEGLGVPRVVRFGRLADGRAYMLRELVEGRSLEELIDQGTELTQTLEALARSADQLTVLHRAGLLHGDVKPANVIVEPEGRATLVDLGLSARWQESGAPAEGLTPRYAAPELFEGKPLTVRAEVYALGIALAEALQHAKSSTVLPEVIERLRTVAARATAAEPSERFPSVDEFGSALRHAAGLPPPEPVSDPAALWPIVGIDTTAARLIDAVQALGPGGVLRLEAPPGSGRSALLRRLAWSLGVEGEPLAWIDEGAGRSAAAVEAELGEHATLVGATVLLDDADALDAASRELVLRARDVGARIVAVGGSWLGDGVQSFEVPPLDEHAARDLVRRAVPSLTPRLLARVVEACGRRPGELRRVVRAVASEAVASAADIERIVSAEQSVISGVPEDPLARAVYYLDKGRFNDARAALDLAAEGEPLTLAIARARLDLGLGEARAALAHLEAVESIAKKRARTNEGKLWQLYLARARVGTGEHQRALEILSAIADEPGALGAEALAYQGLALSYLSRHDEARSALARAVERAHQVESSRGEAIALTCLAVAAQRSDRLDEAKDAYARAITLAERTGDAGMLATLRLNYAGLLKVGGDIAGAIQHYEAAVDMGRRSGRRSTTRQALLNLANTDLYLGRLARARASIEALQEQRSQLPPVVIAQLYGLQAELAAKTGRTETAVRLYESCAAAYETLGQVVDAAEARLEGVVVAARGPRPDLAELRRQVESARSALGDSSAHRSLTYLAMARVAALAGDEVAADEHVDAALATARDGSQREWVWRSLEERAELAEQAGQPLTARRDREEALAVLEQIGARLPRDLREVYWNDPRRRALRASVQDQSRYAALPGVSSVHGVSRSISATATTPLEQRLARILEINAELAGEIDLDRLTSRITDHAVDLLRAERGHVLLVNPEGGLVVYATRSRLGDEPHAEFSRSIAERVIATGDPIVSMSARDDARMRSYASVHQLMLQSVACVPIAAPTGRPIGALYVETRLRPGSHFEQELPTLRAFADQVAIAIETARLIGENKARADELEITNQELEVAQDRLRELLGDRTEKLKVARRKLRDARDTLYSHFGYHGLVGTSAAMRRVYALVDRVRGTDVPILITGESGTGKEMVARAIHDASPRAKGKFLGVNCGAIPEHLLESELFGHVKGAFTGADRDRKGLFREADDGSVLLDEIGEMPQKMQAGLLRVLQDRRVRPVGGTSEDPVDVRLIFATNRDLSAMVKSGTFREDLYYRIHVVEVRLPPLRERVEDIPQLVDHFLGIFAARYKREKKTVSRDALRRLATFEWPGNVRQLEHVLLNAWVLSDRPELDASDFDVPDGLSQPPGAARPPTESDHSRTTSSHSRSSTSSQSRPKSTRSRKSTLSQHRMDERERILKALQACNWNRVKAAELSGIPRRTFYRRLREYGIQ